jgi:cobaltochelatase CobS
MDRLKRCTRCGARKPLSGFHKNKSRPDGHADWCKTCLNASRGEPSKKRGRRRAKKEMPKVEAAVEIDEEYYWQPPEYADAKIILSTGQHVCLVGPAGTGKSRLAQELFRDRGPLRIDFSNGTEEEHIVGQNQLTVNAEGTQVTEFVPAVLAIAVRDGRPIIIEELDAATPGVQFCMHSVLNGDPLVVTCNGVEHFNVTKGFQVIATANTIGLGDDSGMYPDTNFLNEAFRDRFGAIIPLWYMPEEKEVQVARKMTGASLEVVREIVTLANLARDAMRGQKLFSTFSTRKVLRFCEQVVAGLARDKALKYAVLSKVSPDDAKALDEMAQRVFSAEGR